MQARGPTREQGQTHQVEQHLCDRQPKQPASFAVALLQEREQRHVIKQDDQPQDKHLGRCGMPAEDETHRSRR